MQYVGTLPTALGPNDVEDREVHIAMMAHVLNRASDREIALLEEDLDDWRRVLTQHKTKVMALLASMKSEKETREQENRRRGPRFRDQWFGWLAQWSEHRALVVEHGQKVDAAIAFVNQLRHVEAQDHGRPSKELYRLVRDLEERVKAMEAVLIREGLHDRA